MDRNTFTKNLVAFKKVTERSMELALVLSQAAILHFEEHGQLHYCQEFLDAMPNNYSRKPAFLKWLAAHSPITMVDGKLKKDKAENAQAFNTAGAMKKPFWEFAPDKEQVIFGSDDVVIELHKVLKRFANGKRYAASPEGKHALEMAATAITKLEEDLGQQEEAPVETVEAEEELAEVVNG